MENLLWRVFLASREMVAWSQFRLFDYNDSYNECRYFIVCSILISSCWFLTFELSRMAIEKGKLFVSGFNRSYINRASISNRIKIKKNHLIQ